MSFWSIRVHSDVVFMANVFLWFIDNKPSNTEAISQTAFSNEYVSYFDFKFHWNSFLKVRLKAGIMEHIPVNQTRLFFIPMITQAWALLIIYLNGSRLPSHWHSLVIEIRYWKSLAPYHEISTNSSRKMVSNFRITPNIGYTLECVNTRFLV